MEKTTHTLWRRPDRFLLHVLGAFRRNQGMLLSGAVAFYTLLSIVPLLAVLMVGLSHFIPEEQLLATISADVKLILPAHADALTEQVRAFIDRRGMVGTVGIAVLLFFSSMAFTVLENAMSVIFFHRVKVHRRHFLVSAVIPYVYIVLLGVGIVMVSLISGALESLEGKTVVVLGYTWSPVGNSGVTLYVFGLFGLILMLTSLYLVMPVGRIAFHHALIGGITAGLLWELTRHALVWYFANLSFVNVIYGSLATAIVALLSFEIGAIILLLGAQVIAEIEQTGAADHGEPGSGFET